MFILKCRFLALLLIPSFFIPVAGAAQGPPLASGQLEIRGSRLTLHTDASGAGDAEQTINVGERAVVRTCFGGPSVPCGSVQAGDPRITSLRVEAELSGPELPQPLALTTVPGGAFHLPGFQREGEYTLENIRLVNTESGQVITLADPSLAVLHVRRIVLASAQVRALSLEELRARGIELSQENFQAFDFAVGFAIEGQTVEIEFPVLFEGNGLAQGLSAPRIVIDDLPASVVELVKAWKPPTIKPIRIGPAPRSASNFDIGEEEPEELSFPLFGAIVVPGTVTFLNQFFEAELIVANGAPADSQAHLGRLRALARLPGNQALRLAETEPPVVPGQWVPVIGADGSQILSPREQGSAAWVIEGLRPGTHSLIFEIEGELERPGRDPLPVRSLAQAAVEVVDARFQLTFSHPDVVRRDEEYGLFVTVTNQSLAAQNQITVEIRSESLTGAAPADQDDPLSHTIASLRPGESATVEFRLVSLTTGKVIATTFQSDSANYQGTIQLRAGVGELGIPLSPATLLMPRFTSELEARSPNLVRANASLLGLAYSLAVAPASLLPPGLASLQKADVERRAIDLAEAGERLYLGERYLESLEALLLDQLANRHPLEGYDLLRRSVSKGLRAAEGLAAELRREQQTEALDAAELFDHLASTMSYARPFLAALLVPVDGSPLPALEAIDRLGGTGLLAGAADRESAARRTLPFGEMYSLRAEGSADNPRADLAVVGHLEGDTATTFLLRSGHGQPTRARLLLLAPDGDGGFRRLDYGVLTLAAGEILAIDAGAAEGDAGQGGFRPYDPLTGEPRSAAPYQSTVPLPSFRIIGARQDFFLDFSVDHEGNQLQPNRYGNGITYLFNRPPAASLAQTPQAFVVESLFDGQAADDSPYPASNRKVGRAAFVQPNSERVVIVRYDGGLSPLLEGGTPLVEHRHALDSGSIRDGFGQALAFPVPDPVVESSPIHVGALVGGQVKRGTGLSVDGVTVDLVRMRWFSSGGLWILYPDLAATTTTQADGRFFFDFVESPIPDPNIKPELFLRATVPAGADPLTEPAEVAQVSYSVRRQNKAMVVNIALLGRGGITGRLTYLDNGAPVAGGTVEAASTLFHEQQKVEVEQDGSFRLVGLPVGPISLAGRDAEGRRVYATVEIAAPGAVTDIALKIQRLGTVPPARGAVFGKVLYLRDGIAEEALGATVAIYSGGHFVASKEVGAGGSFAFTDVPAGRVALQAANFRMSRTAVYTDLMLGGEEVRELELRIPGSSPKTVVGQVWQREAGGALAPMSGATVLLIGPGNLTHTGPDGRFTLENVPVQGSQQDAFRLQIVNPGGTEQKIIDLPIILAGSPDQVIAPTVVFESGSVRGSVRGRIYDPQGRPVPNAGVVLYPFAEVTAGADGSYLFENVPLGNYFVVAKVGDGLTPGKVGYLGRSESFAVDRSNASPVVDIAMRGSGFVKIHTRTETSTGILTPIFYRPTYYSGAAKDIVVRGSHTEASTNPNGDFEVELPLGDFVIVAYNPFHGQKEIRGQLTAVGQVARYEIVFESLGKVSGTVVGNDGSTPVPFAEVVLSTRSLLPQTLQADEQGRFLFELVPAGPVTVEARAITGNVERVGRTLTSLRHGEERELTVVMLSQGSITGRVMQETSPGQLAPVPNAQYFVTENAYPNRRLPAGTGNYYFTDAAGRYEVPHLFAGEATIVARDSNDVSRQGSSRATIAVDWSVVSAPDIVFRGADAVGRIAFLVRDPQTGAPVADAIVRLSTGEGSVTGSDGRVVFEALKVGASISNARKYSARAFYAPTGQAGESASISLYQAGQDEMAEIYLDQRGEVSGFLYDDDSRTEPIAGATVRLEGYSVAGRVEVLATTSGEAADRGSFLFTGIPEGAYALTAASTETPRRAAATVALTDTSPIVSLFLFLEQVGDLYFRIDQKLRAGNLPVDLSAGVFSVRVLQGDANFPDYSFTSLLAEPASNVFLFEDVFLERQASITARELGGELRLAGASTPDFLLRSTLNGGGTYANPFRLLLPPKGSVTAQVRDADALPVEGINVRLSAAGSSQTSATGADGKATFIGVNAGAVTVSAKSLDGISSGSAQGAVLFDDDALELTITFLPAVLATGRVYAPLPFDQAVSDPSLLEPSVAARVELVDRRGIRHVSFTDASGSYLFEGLPTGSYSISAASADGLQIAAGSGDLLGPNGNLNQIPALVLDGGPPAIVHISPQSGSSGVPTDAIVEIRFSEPLASAFLPVGATSAYFSLRRSSGGVTVTGNWVHLVDGGQQVVRFVPSPALADFTLYSLTVSGAVTDRAGRRLTASGNVGISFRTEDGLGPTVLSSEPSLARPVHPQASIRADFSEKVVAAAEDLDGDGVADAALLEAQRLDGSWVALPAVYYLTRLDYSLQLDLPQGLEVPNDSLRRRLSLSRLHDESGNLMTPWQREFRLFDSNTPTLAVAPPAGAPDGNLLRGASYTLAPALGNLDDLGPQTPGGDIDRIEYFFADPAASTSAPGHVARAHPFAYAFVAAYVGSGEPRPFPVWVRAIDTSNNVSPVVLVDLRVLPNAPPVIAGVSASHPVNAQIFYSRQPIDVTVTGIADADSTSLSLLVDLVRGDTAAVVRQLSRTLAVPGAGWPALPPPVFTFTGADTGLPEGTPILVRATAVDASSARASAEASYVIADDAVPPVVSGISVVDPLGASRLQFELGETIRVRFSARDDQSGLKPPRVTFDRTDIFSQPPPVTGYQGSFSTAGIRIPAGVVNEPAEVVATVESEDYGGNVTRESLAFRIQPADDPFAPVVSFTSPFAGAQWPADYTSALPGAGVPLLLRLKVTDSSRDEAGATVPGEIYSVEVRGPELAVDGSVALSEAWAPATLVAGTGAPGAGEYQALWYLPNDVPPGVVLSFAARAIDLGAAQTIAVTEMTTVPARRVYQGVATSVLPEDPMLDFAGSDPSGPVFLLDGSLLSIYPRTDGSLRQLPSLFLYSGGFTSSGSLVRRDSRLVPVEINSLDSAILYYPLELEVETFLGVGAGSAIDGDGAGLLGGTLSRPILLPGIEGPRPFEAGYHGGMGSFAETDPAWLPRVYGDPRWPLLPGLGGRTNAVSADFRQGGGPGGGAIRLEAGSATVRLEGLLSARGKGAPRGSSGLSFGGAGGSIALRAGRLEGNGTIDASAPSSYLGSAGGGRVAVLYGQLGEDFDAARQIRAQGGGAGTIYLEQLGEAGSASGVGRLRLANPAGSLGGVTLVTGAGDDGFLRYEQIELAGAVRLLALQDLVLGSAESPSSQINDETYIHHDGIARWLLRGQLGSIADDPSLPPGDILYERKIEVPIVFSHPLGLEWIRSRWSYQTEAAQQALDQDVQQSLVQIASTVRDLPPGPLRLMIEAHTADGATLQRTLEWNLLPNELPSVTVTPQSATVEPNGTLLVTVAGEDREALGILKLAVDASWHPETLVFAPAAGALGAEHIFAVSVPVGAAAGPLELVATAVDSFGEERSARATVAIGSGDGPAASWRLADDQPTELAPGSTFFFAIDAQDPNGDLAEVRIAVEGPASPSPHDPELVAELSGYEDGESYAFVVARQAVGGETIVFRAEVADHQGNVFALPPLSFTTLADDDPPEIEIEAPPAVTAGTSLSVRVVAHDATLGRLEIDFDGRTTTVEPWEGGDSYFFESLPVTGPAAPASLLLVVRAYDLHGNTSEASRVVELLPDLPPVAQLSYSSDTYDEVLGQNVVVAGSVVTVGISAADDVGLAAAQLSVAGIVARQESGELSGDSGYLELVVEVPLSAEVGDQLIFSGTVTDTIGQSAAPEPATIEVTRLGLLPPQLRLYIDPENADGRYEAGSTLQVIATGRRGIDASAPVSIELDGRLEAGTGAVAGEWILPAVSTATELSIRARVEGEEGLTGEVERRITVLPGVPSATAVSFLCPSAGALLPAGVDFPFGLAAQAAAGISRIELYRGGDLLGTLAPEGAPLAYSGALTVTLPAQPGSVSYRAVVIPASGPIAEAAITIGVAPATLLDDPGTGIDWPALASSTVALGAGIWTFDQPRHFENLVLLPGARIVHSELPAAGAQPPIRVDLRVAGELYVACGAAVDVSGRGHRDAENTLGGAHFGDGGLGARAGSALREPRRAGGGSGASRGGGVAWIKAGSLTVDGELLADGQGTETTSGGGAGGSLWIRIAGEIAGQGRIAAEGAGCPGSGFGAGGGGVVSLEYASLSAGLLARISAQGGGGAHPGGAGAVVLVEPERPFGRLVVDGGDNPGAASSLVGFAFSSPLQDGVVLEGNTLTVSVHEPRDQDPEDLIGALLSIPWGGEGADEAGRPYFRVVDARFRPAGCSEDDPFCLCYAGGACPPCPEEDPNCNCAINGDCVPCPEEDPFCHCGSGGTCPGLAGSAGPAELPYEGLFTPRSYQRDRYEFELRNLDGSDIEPFDPTDLFSAGFFDHLVLRGHTRIGIAGLSTGLVEIDGHSSSLQSHFGAGAEVAVESLFLRRDARLESTRLGDSGTADLEVRKDLILARGAAIDHSGGGRGGRYVGDKPAGSGLSHIGTGGGLGAYHHFTHYDDIFDPVLPGEGFWDSGFGGGAMKIAADVAYFSAETALLANGDSASAQGGASGGALQISARLLEGEALIEARGGASATQHGGGGGGIAVSWQETRGSWQESLKACGGAPGPGKEAGGAGTVLLRGPAAVLGDLHLDNCGHRAPITYGITPEMADNLAVRGGARIAMPKEIVGAGRLQLGGPGTVELSRIEAEELVLEGGVVLTVPTPVSPSLPKDALVIRLTGDLVLESGARIDMSGQGLGGPHPDGASSAGNHIGYRPYTNAPSRGRTYGSIVRPREPGTGTDSVTGASGGGVLDIEAANVLLGGVDSGLLANGADTAFTSGGSILLRTGTLEGDGFIEARGGLVAGSTGGGGGGAIALELDASGGTLLQNVRAWGGGNAATSAGAGSVFLFDRSVATHGVLRLDNDGRPGTTELPSLGSGAAASGTAGAELVTSLTAIPPYFVGHWVEVRSGAGILKGQWRIESISGNRLELAPNGSEALALAPGDGWTGFYVFDRLERDVLVSFESIDPLRAPIVDYSASGFAALEAMTPELGAQPVPGGPDLSRILVEAAEIEGLYRISVPASIFPTPRSFAWIRLGQLDRSVTAAFDRVSGATFLWAGEPGDTLQLQAYDPARPASPLSLELPALAAGASSLGFGVNLHAEENILDFFAGERTSWLLLCRGEQLELLEIDPEARAIFSLGTLPRLYAEHRLALRDGAVGIAARGGEDGLPDAFFRLGPAGFEPIGGAGSDDPFALPAGAAGRYVPVTADLAGTEK